MPVDVKSDCSVRVELPPNVKPPTFTEFKIEEALTVALDIERVPAPTALDPEMVRFPLVTRMPPVKLLLPEMFTVPFEPVLTRDPPPEIAPERVSDPEAETETAPPSVIGAEIALVPP